MTLTWQQSIGIDESHLKELADENNESFKVHTDVIEALSKLLTTASKDGVAISIVSGFRNFERQLAIWNDKWQGYKPVYSRQGRPLNILQMSNIEKYKAISLWSALPGLSRHHWGTDFDIFATQAISDGYQVQLQPHEFAEKGPCNRLELWMKDNLESLGFFRPYRNYQQGVSAEPWHISHIKTSQNILNNFDKNSCKEYLANSGIKDALFIKEQFEHYYHHYFCNICNLSCQKENQ